MDHILHTQRKQLVDIVTQYRSKCDCCLWLRLMVTILQNGDRGSRYRRELIRIFLGEALAKLNELSLSDSSSLADLIQFIGKLTFDPRLDRGHGLAFNMRQ